MKNYLFTLSLLFVSLLITAQENSDTPLGRNGQWTFEAGNGLFTTFGGSSTGGSVIFADGSAFSNLFVNGGKFVSDQFAVKFNVGMISVSTGFGSSDVFNLMGGGKYYFGDKFPVDLTAGILTGQGSTVFVAKGTLGYAIPLADNINLEPAVGVIVGEDEANGLVQMAFAMFF